MNAEATDVIRDEPRKKSLSRTYTSWANMIQRCTNPNNTAYDRYGGAGISVCKRWRRFDNFLADMGRAPDGLTLERIHGSRDYYKANCKWATYKEQSSNRPRFCRYVEIGGERLTLKEAWRRSSCQIQYRGFLTRIDKQGMSFAQAIAAPSRYSTR